MQAARSIEAKADGKGRTGLKDVLEDTSKFLSVLTDVCKFALLATLSAFAIAAMADPGWARQKLRDAGITVEEVNAFGVKVKLAANDGFDIAKAVADARLKLEAVKGQAPQSGAAGGAGAVSQALAELDNIQVSLARQSDTLKAAQDKAGVVPPPIPATGWLFVGRIAEDKTFQPGARIDASGTRIEDGKVTRIQMKSASPVVENGDECVRTSLEEVKPPSGEELQGMQVLLDPNPAHPLDVVATAGCPSIGNGRFLYAKIRIPKDDVKFVKYETLVRR